MKTKKVIQKTKSFDTVKTFRAIKEKISADMAEMTNNEIKEYLRKSSDRFNKELSKL